MVKTLVVIPARYGSSRFPGKPLAKIAGKEMLLRVVEIAKKGTEACDAQIVVATEDGRILNFCKEHDILCLMTSDACKTGSDRVCEAVKMLNVKPELIINLQGDNPVCPPWFIKELIKAFEEDPMVDLVTPITQLSWEALDKLRESKKTTPFSGTTCVVDKDGYALWFSKNIIPAIRKEADLRTKQIKSPVYRHIGLYGYKSDSLFKFKQLDESDYEKLEGLEQLRFLENGMRIKTAIVDYGHFEGMSGVDSPEDILRAEALFAKYGEF
ncbi:MAG: 3-deoxy-manno-octulosonate cytidylyltransferase [Alphaproteobacteria bacterium]|nr:3-deoxy-manno-octulosonate cytidylyltransferase [Alphaproteobacteria bacterium]